jgi:hypothetical protein
MKELKTDSKKYIRKIQNSFYDTNINVSGSAGTNKIRLKDSTI